MKNKTSLKERILYWFDNKMAQGTGMMICMLFAFTISLVILIGAVIHLCGFSEDSTIFSALWDSLATTINAWMPYSDEGGAGYIILTAISATIGVFFTSFLIGIISSAVEEKLTQLRKGNSVVLEEGHIVLLGFKPGEYEIIQQLILAAGDDPRCIVIADQIEKDEMEDAIRDNLDVPKNVRIICRNAIITDPVSLECCSIPFASNVIIKTNDDNTTIKSILAVRKVLEEEHSDVRIITAVSNSSYLLPEETCKKQNILMFKTNHVVARIIAHCCMQPGLSECFSEVFNFTGNEFYIVENNQLVGMTYKEICLKANKAIPVGIVRNNRSILKPPFDTIYENGDQLICFSESKNDLQLMDIPLEDDDWNTHDYVSYNETEKITIIGMNDGFDTLINELDDSECQIELTICGMSELEYEQATQIIAPKEHISLSISELNITKLPQLESVVKDTDHVIILSDGEFEEEESDMHNTLILLNLRDIKDRLGLEYTITTQMYREESRNLIANSAYDDFIVSSHLASMIQAQLAETAELYELFKEILSNSGNEFHLRYAYEYELSGQTKTVAFIRNRLIIDNMLLLGFVKNEEDNRQLILNPDLDATIELGEDDELIVIGE